MSAIWGIKCHKMDSELRNMFFKMCDIMPFNSSDTVNTQLGHNFALGHSTINTIHNEGYPFYLPDGEYISVCGIPIWESDYPFEKLCEPHLGKSLSDAEYIHNSLHSKRLGDLGGVYAFAIWNPDETKLTLGTDRLGFRGLYYLYDKSKDIVFFASRLRGIVDLSNKKELNLNWQAILEFLHFGHPLGEKTFYSDINLLPPGTVLHFSNNKIKEEKYWDINSIQIDKNKSYSEYMKSNQEAFSIAIDRRIQKINENPIAVFLSGGADSRRIAAEIYCQDRNYRTFTTMGFSAHDSEGPIASDIASTLKAENTFIELPMPGFVRDYWSKANRLMDYECCLHQWLLPLVEKIQESSMINFDGIGGDLPMNGVFRASGFADPENFFSVKNSDLSNKVSCIIGKNMKFSFLKDSIQKRLSSGSLRKSVKQELIKYNNSEDQLMLFYFMNRTRRSIILSANRILQKKVETVFPYLDLSVLRSVMSIPLEYRINRPIRKDIINNIYPFLSHIPYTQYRQSIGGYNCSYGYAYRAEKAYQLKSNIYNHFIKNNIAFKSMNVFPKFIICLILSFIKLPRIPYEMSLSFSVFYDWLSEYGDSKLKI